MMDENENEILAEEILAEKLEGSFSQGAPKEEPEDLSKVFKDKYLRALAEMENMRKRMQKEKQESTRFAIENVVSDFLTPLDNFEKALGFTSHMSEETKNWAQGFTMILSQFKDALASNGIIPFDSEGSSFDPHLHEAVETKETDEVKEGTVVKEYVKGYKSGDRTIRPARVAVAKAPKKGKEEIKEKKDEETL